MIPSNIFSGINNTFLNNYNQIIYTTMANNDNIPNSSNNDSDNDSDND